MNHRIGILTLTTPSEREILITRHFDAPRARVFDVMTRPELLEQWLLGPPGWSMVVCENEPETGGTFRHVWRNCDGTELTMRGSYREVVPPELIVRTESLDFDNELQAGELLATVVLSERAGGTRVTLTVLYPTRNDRDAAIASCIELGVAASYDRLAVLLVNARIPTVCH